jgi:4-amino-4-deoxy-L-arabinose transferase-like glycosyltransferase
VAAAQDNGTGKGKLVLALILGLFVAFAAGHVFLTPYRTAGVQEGVRVPEIGAPDERAHANYVTHLMEGKGLPVVDPRSPDRGERYEMHQPPAYYLVAAGWARLWGHDTLETPAAGRTVRMLGLLFGAALVLFVYWGVAASMGSTLVAAFAVASMCLLPMFCATTSWVNNDAMAFALCALALALTLVARVNGWSFKYSLGVGLALGLAILTKTSALGIVPPILFAMMGSGGHRPTMGRALTAMGLAALMTLPWWIRNTSLYGDPLGLAMFREQFGGNPYFERMGTDSAALKLWLYDFSRMSAMSFIGIFGTMHILLPKALYALFATAYSAMGTGWLWSWRRVQEAPERFAHRFAAVGILSALVLYVRFNLEQHQPQARYLYPCLLAFGLAFALGARGLFGRRLPGALAALVIALAVLNVYALSRLPDEFKKRTEAGISPAPVSSLP